MPIVTNYISTVIYMDMRWSKKSLKYRSQADVSFKMPLRFVWGVQDVDDGDYLDPGDRGLIRYDESFDVSSADAQRWMLRFCQQLRKQKFYRFVNDGTVVTGRLYKILVLGSKIDIFPFWAIVFCVIVNLRMFRASFEIFFEQKTFSISGD